MNKSNTDVDGRVGSPDASGGESMSYGRAMTYLLIGLIAHTFTAPWVKIANFEPATSALLRVAIALLVLVPFGLREKARLGGISKTGVLLSLLGGVFLGIDFTAFNYSIFLVGSGIAMVLLNMQVIILPLLAIIFDGYRPPRSYYALVPIMLFGVALTGGVFNVTPNEGPATYFGIDTALLGTILGAASGSCYGVYLYATRKASKVNPGRIIQPMVWAMVAQLVFPAIWTRFSGRGFDLAHGVLINGQLPLNPETTLGDPIMGINWFWMIVLATAGQALTWTFIQYGSVRLEPSIVAGLILLSPVATVFLVAWPLLGEVPSALQILGVVIVLGSVAFQNNLHVAIMKRRRRATSP